MSTKSAKKAPKLPPMEAIVTRNRSAQLRRQLRNTDQSMKKIIQITKLLRSPTRAEMAQIKSTKKHQESKKGTKSPKATQKSQKKVVNGNEFYPNKLKRMVKAKKVLLKPKHEMKSIAVGVSKRKLGVPQKETTSSSPKRMRTELRHSELSIMDLLRMSDESETLNDEDLMEILTCESPVWWEDPPDEGYIEDPIFLRDEAIEETHSDQSWSLEKGRKKKVKPKMYKAEQHNTETDDNSLKQLDSKKTDDKFMKKRSKLENLLSNIKNKLNTESEATHIGGLVTNNKESTDTVDNFDQKVMNIDEIDKTNDEASVNEPVTNKKSAEGNTNMEQMSRKNKSQSESEGEDIFSGFRDDDILRNLENMDIPIGETNNGCEDSSSKNVKNTKCTSNSEKDSAPVNTSVDSTHVKSEDTPVEIENKSFEVEDVTLPACNNTESKDLKIEFDKTEQEMQETGSTDLNYIETISNTVKDENHTAVNEDSCKKESSDKDLKDPVTDISNLTKDTPDDIPTTLPILQKNPINNIEKITASPISVKSVISEDCYETSSLVSNPDAMDTISDTNIHFIDDDNSSKHSEESLRETEKTEAVKDNVDEIKETEVDMSLSKVEGNDKINLDSEQPKSSASNPLNVKLVYSSIPKSKEYMTVYKIITGDNMDLNSKETEVKSDKGTEELASKASKDMKCYEKVEYQNGNLNAFFKICKNSYQRRPRKLETIVNSDTQNQVKSTQNQHNKKDTTETILVSNTNNVKYCRKCSSIFDTEICGYCNKKETHERSGSNTVDKQYSCDLCEFRTSCKSAIVQHVTDHD